MYVESKSIEIPVYSMYMGSLCSGCANGPDAPS